MNYTTEIDLNLPLNRVVELFDNPDNMFKWQPELVSFKHVSGTPGKEGAKSKLRYKMGKRDIEMTETITNNNLPKELSGTYEAKGVKNWITNKFVEVGPEKTKWISENEFQFQGYMKLMGMLMPGAFKKQSMKYHRQFKEFAENAV